MIGAPTGVPPMPVGVPRPVGPPAVPPQPVAPPNNVAARVPPPNLAPNVGSGSASDQEKVLIL